MFGYRFLRAAAAALAVYGVLGLLVAGVLLVVGSATFQQVSGLSTTLEHERVALVRSIRTASVTLRDTASATQDFQRSLGTARDAADKASKLANDSAGTFRDMGGTMGRLEIFGFQPLATIAPQFDRSADQLQELAISLGSTREALGQNGADVQRVGGDLSQLQRELDDVATSLDQPGVLGVDARTMLPFQVAFYGMCALMILQSLFSMIAGLVLFRLQRALGTAVLFPALSRAALPQPAAEPERLTLVH